MAAENNKPLPATPRWALPYHPDYIWPVTGNQSPEVRYSFGDSTLNNLQVVPATEKEGAGPDEKEVALHNANSKTRWYERLTRRWKRFRELIGANRRGPYLGLTRRLFVILVLKALVIGGIIVLLLKLVSSGAKKASAPAEIDPYRRQGIIHCSIRGRTRIPTNLLLQCWQRRTEKGIWS